MKYQNVILINQYHYIGQRIMIYDKSHDVNIRQYSLQLITMNTCYDITLLHVIYT